MKVLYFAHDLADAAIQRRVRLLREGGAIVTLIGFERDRGVAASGRPEGRSIGVTYNGRLWRRIAAIAKAAVRRSAYRDEMLGAEIILARSLEMMLIAVLARARLRLVTPIVYECLDIHRLMTRSGPAGWLLRMTEQRLLDLSALLIVSSPRFIKDYFASVHRRLPPWILLENKLLSSEFGDRAAMPRPDGPPWRIGWFGVIRCARSLSLLAELVESAPGAIEVEIYGRPARDVVPDFDAIIAGNPGLHFHGPYDRATDLPALYGQVHFNWTLDFYEAGLNSDWLLPNRLYEGSAFGAVPIALKSVETGRWLAERSCGVLLEEPVARSLLQFFAALNGTSYQILQANVMRLDKSDFLENPESAAKFVDKLRHLRDGADTGAVIPWSFEPDRAA